jgi:hypothetical protein
MTPQQVRDYVRYNWSYMGGTVRSVGRINQTGEVFTPTSLAQEMIDQFPEAYIKNTVFRDTSCGDGQLLSEILIKKVELGVTFETAITQVIGCDIMSINVELCRKRLSCGNVKYYEILKKQIVIGNALDCLADVEDQTETDKLQMIDLFGGDIDKLLERVKNLVKI